MNIITQLVEFIFVKRDVKDITHDPKFAVVAILLDAAPLLFICLSINESGINLGEVTITKIPVGLVIVYTALFTALFYSFFAAQQKQARFVQAATAFFGASFILTLANLVTSVLPGSQIFTLIILGLKIFCSVRVAMQALGYNAFRSVFSLFGITMLAMIIASTIFPIETTQLNLPTSN